MNCELTKIYSRNESQPCIYIFETKITNIYDETTIQRMSTILMYGNIMSVQNNIKSIKITVICMKNLKSTTLYKTFKTHNNKPALLLYKNNIIISMNTNANNIDITYKIC